MVSSFNGYKNWAKQKGLPEKELFQLIREYQKETGKNLRVHSSYYPNQTERINKSRKRFQGFTQWYAAKKRSLQTENK